MGFADTLNGKLEEISRNFAQQVVDAIRGAPISDLILEAHGAQPLRRTARSPSAQHRNGTGRPPNWGKALDKIATSPSGRLARRTPEQIAEDVTVLVKALKSAKGGLRSEQLQPVLSWDKRALPRVIAAALKAKVIKRKGQRRATVYFAA